MSAISEYVLIGSNCEWDSGVLPIWRDTSWFVDSAVSFLGLPNPTCLPALGKTRGDRRQHSALFWCLHCPPCSQFMSLFWSAMHWAVILFRSFRPVPGSVTFSNWLKGWRASSNNPHRCWWFQPISRRMFTCSNWGLPVWIGTGTIFPTTGWDCHGPNGSAWFESIPGPTARPQGSTGVSHLECTKHIKHT